MKKSSLSKCYIFTPVVPFFFLSDESDVLQDARETLAANAYIDSLRYPCLPRCQ